MIDYKELTKQTYNLIAKDYVARDKIEIAETKEVSESLQHFISLLPNKAKVLDVGIGGGRDARVFAQKGCLVTGIDIADDLVQEGRIQTDTNNITYLTMDVENLDFPPSSFDAIWANASLHHIPKANLPKVLTKLFAILKKDGYLQIKVHKGNSEGIVTENKFGKNIKRYFAKYNVSELKHYVESADFAVLYAKPATQNKWVDLLAKKDIE